MAQVEQKRIGVLTPLTDDEVDDIIKSTQVADEWSIAMDYVVPDTDGEPPRDQGTKKISGSRIGFLTRNRLVPQNMLPSIIADDAIYDGEMVKNGNTMTFTVTEVGSAQGKKFVCPKPTASGEYLPSIDTIYRDVLTVDNRKIYTQYRYIPRTNAGTADETGEFVPIPSDLVMVGGEGTVVNDDVVSSYSRKIDINIGTPSPEPNGGTNVLFIDTQDNSRKLVHSTSGVTAGTYPATQSTAPGFGATFNVPKLTVNPTGHMTVAGADAVTVPATAAGVGTAGLVVIGTDADISPIGATPPGPSIGSIPSSGYVKVAAADHVHTASNFNLLNTNDGNKTYNGSGQVEYDFRKFLKTILPASAPAASGTKILVTTSASPDSAGYRSTAWVDIDSVLIPRYAFIPLASSNTIATTGTTLSLGSTLTKFSALTLVTPSSGSPTKIQGLVAGKLYVVTFTLVLERTSAGTYLDNFTFAVMNGSTNAENARVNLVIDETITGTGRMPNYVNGTIFFTADSGQTQCYFKVTIDRSDWKVNGTGSLIQVSEVK